MKIKPVEAYEPPRYSSFDLKTGGKLAVGAACLALVASLASGCGAIDTLSGVVGGINPKPTPESEALDGDVVSVPDTLCAPESEMLLGEIAEPEVLDGMVPAQDFTPGETAGAELRAPSPEARATGN